MGLQETGHDDRDRLDQEPRGIPSRVPDIQLLYNAKSHRERRMTRILEAVSLLSPGGDGAPLAAARRWRRRPTFTIRGSPGWEAEFGRDETLLAEFLLDGFRIRETRPSCDASSSPRSLTRAGPAGLAM